MNLSELIGRLQWLHDEMGAEEVRLEYGRDFRVEYEPGDDHVTLTDTRE